MRQRIHSQVHHSHISADPVFELFASPKGTIPQLYLPCYPLNTQRPACLLSYHPLITPLPSQPDTYPQCVDMHAVPAKGQALHHHPLGSGRFLTKTLAKKHAMLGSLLPYQSPRANWATRQLQTDRCKEKYVWKEREKHKAEDKTNGSLSRLRLGRTREDETEREGGRGREREGWRARGGERERERERESEQPKRATEKERE